MESKQRDSRHSLRARFALRSSLLLYFIYLFVYVFPRVTHQRERSVCSRCRHRPYENTLKYFFFPFFFFSLYISFVHLVSESVVKEVSQTLEAIFASYFNRRNYFAGWLSLSVAVSAYFFRFSYDFSCSRKLMNNDELGI